MAYDLRMPLPPWLRRAVRKQVMSYPEAQLIWALASMASPVGEQPCYPECLQIPLNNLALLNAPAKRA